MPVLGLLYPAFTLAALGDPLQFASPENPLSRDEVVQRLERVLGEKLAALPGYTSPSAANPDERWYWAAPLLLDVQENEQAARSWFEQRQLAEKWLGELTDFVEEGSGPSEIPVTSAWSAHVEAARAVARGGTSLGAPPVDLARVLALLSLAGPGVAALRALARVSGGLGRSTAPTLRNVAGQVAEGFRSLFNQPEVMALIRREYARTGDETAYWHMTLEYGVTNNLQAVLDEYAHVLVEDRGVSGRPVEQIEREVAEGMQEALLLRTSSLDADEVAVGREGVRIGPSPLAFRTSFAVRFGARRTDEAGAVRREGDVQKAFNSPFWPFVLCSTSVGQEGLDFHRYCHAVVHWNLPSNPVDLEQREGRIHRFKGHAVRKNIASDFGARLRYSTDGVEADPWVQMFELARQDRQEDLSDLVPFWVYTTDGGSFIERHMPMVGLSRDVERADRLKRSLAVYRMAFGQSRQDDLVQYLLRHLSKDRVDQIAKELSIDLSPHRKTRRDDSGRQQEPGELVGEQWGVEQPPPDGLGLGELESLLDQFSALRPAESQWSAALFEPLLDEFARLSAR
jgi:hypothetical protein